MSRRSYTRKGSLKDGVLHPAGQLAERLHPRVRKVELTFPDGIIPVTKGIDNIWRCPRCKQEFGAVARDLKEHATSGACMARPRGGAVRQSTSSKVRLRIGPTRAEAKAQDIEYIARLVRPEDEDDFDANEVLMKLEDESELGGSGHVPDAVPADSRVQTDTMQDDDSGLPDKDQEVPTVTPEHNASQEPTSEPDAAGSLPDLAYPAIDESTSETTPTPTNALSGSMQDQGTEAARNSVPDLYIRAFRSLSVAGDNSGSSTDPALLSPAIPSRSLEPASPSRSSTHDALVPPAVGDDATYNMTGVVQATPTPLTDFTTSPESYPDTVPQALRLFLDTLIMKRDFLPAIFVQREFDSEEALDLLCQSSQEEEYHWLIQEIQTKSHFVSLAVKKGLHEREDKLKMSILMD